MARAFSTAGRGHVLGTSSTVTTVISEESTTNETTTEPTKKGNVAKTFSTGDLLKDLWDNNIDFRDQFSQALDRKYPRSGIKNWCHLAEKFQIPRSTYESFTGSKNISPSENMLDHLETTKPTMKVRFFMDACQRAKSSDICSFFRKHITAGKVLETDEMAALWDKAHDVIDNLLLMLDRNESWMYVAKDLKIPREKYQIFQSGPDSNKAHDLFEILTKEEFNKPLTVQDLKSKLQKIQRDDVKKLLDEEESISDSSLLTKVPGTLYNIEQQLSSHDPKSVYELAKLYKAVNGCFKDRDIELLFHPEDSGCSPTKSLIDYVIKAHPEEKEPTVGDLIIHLLEINRDPQELIEGYLKGGKEGKDELNRIRVEFDMANLRVAPIPNERQSALTQTEDVVRIPIQEETVDQANVA